MEKDREVQLTDSYNDDANGLTQFEPHLKCAISNYMRLLLAVKVRTLTLDVDVKARGYRVNVKYDFCLRFLQWVPKLFLIDKYCLKRCLLLVCP